MRNRPVFLLLIYTIIFGPICEGVLAQNIKESPKRRPPKAQVELEWVENLEECQADRVCIEGQLYNTGRKTAYHVHLKIELGGTKYIKPTTYLYKKVEQTIMNPGDRQQFYFELDRKIPYKKKKKIKFFDVGKFNYKVVPQWRDRAKKTR